MSQITNNILMVRPTGFTYNEETAVNNHFQNPIKSINSKKVTENAIREFDEMVALLGNKGVSVHVVDPKGNKNNPDAVFPNNWFSVHEDGTRIIYPMFAKSRRKERNLDIFKSLEKNILFNLKKNFDLTFYEDENLFLEGTGSMVLDRVNKIAYATLSERTSLKVLRDFSKTMRYKMVYFDSFHNSKDKKNPIYHTNVMLTVGNHFAVVCSNTISDRIEKFKLMESFEISGKEVVEISISQMNNFAGNILQVMGSNETPLIVMSKTAFNSMDKPQISRLEKYGELISPSLKTIETYGGGSARCMMAELFFYIILFSFI
jgi:hypothetical protein